MGNGRLSEAGGPQNGHERETFLEFAGRTISVRSAITEVHSYLERTYGPMVSKGPAEGVGQFNVFTAHGRCVADGPSSREVEDNFGRLEGWLKQELLKEFIRTSAEFLWFHAGAAARDGQTVIFPGGPGRGKSTLVTRLCDIGWRYLSDDVAPVHINSQKVFPFPLEAKRRLDNALQLPFNRVDTLLRESVPVERATAASSGNDLSAVIFPEFQMGEPVSISALRPGDAAFELLRHCMNFVDHKTDGIPFVAALTQSTSAFKLIYSNGVDAAIAVNSLLASSKLHLAPPIGT